MSKRKQYPSQERLRELFDYDPEGFLVWRHRPDVRPCVASRTENCRAGSVCVDNDHTSQYRVSIDENTYEGGRLIWVYHFGEVPKGKIVRRKDGVGWFDINNLELKDDVHDKQNKRKWKSKNNYLGVYKKKNSFGWNCCNQDGTEATYDTEENAAIAYDNGAEECGLGRPNETNGKDVSGNVITKSLSRYISNAMRVKNSGNFIGVYRHKNGKDYTARFAGKNIKGRFSSKEQAARAYNIAAYEHYGEQAMLNDIPDPLGNGDVF